MGNDSGYYLEITTVEDSRYLSSLKVSLRAKASKTLSLSFVLFQSFAVVLRPEVCIFALELQAFFSFFLDNRSGLCYTGFGSK